MMMMRKLILSSLIALAWTLVFSAGGAGAVPLNNPIIADLVAAYEFSGNADDSSGSGNDGVVHGATLTTDRFGNANSAYSFDGMDDYILSSTNFPGQLKGTIAFWVRASSRGAFISSRSTSGYEQGDFFFSNNETTDGFGVAYWEGPNWETMGTGGAPFGHGVWKHVAFSWDTEDVSRFYLDGSSYGQSSSGSSTAPSYQLFSGLPLMFGNDQVFHFGTWVTNFATGDLDDVYIYDRALSPTEVQTLYSAVPEPSTALLLGLGLAGMAAARRRAR